jgi:hypothetical protein
MRTPVPNLYCRSLTTELTLGFHGPKNHLPFLRDFALGLPALVGFLGYLV